MKSFNKKVSKKKSSKVTLKTHHKSGRLHPQNGVPMVRSEDFKK